MDGTKIVYSGRAIPGGSGAVWDIYLYDIATGVETKLTSQSGHQTTKPSISGNYAVWIDYRNGYTGDLYLYNLATNTGTRLTTNDRPKYNLASIDGNRIVWSEYRYGNNDIFLYSISSGTGAATPQRAFARVLDSLAQLVAQLRQLVAALR